MQQFKVRTEVHAGQTPPGFPGQQVGWWWMQRGYIARPGRPVKEFMGWYYGPAPMFYYPAYTSPSFSGPSARSVPGAPGAAPQAAPTDGTIAPPAPGR